MTHSDREAEGTVATEQRTELSLGLSGRPLLIGVVAVMIGGIISWISASTGARVNQSNPVDPGLAQLLSSGHRIVMECPEGTFTLGRRWDVRGSGTRMIKITERRPELLNAINSVSPYLQDARSLNMATPISGCRLGTNEQGQVLRALITDPAGTGQANAGATAAATALVKELREAGNRITR